MKLEYLKEKEELVSIVLLGFSAFFAILILVKVTSFFTASARAENLIKKAVGQNNKDNNIDKYFTKYKEIADELKKNNLFAPPPPKEHPVKEKDVIGILGDEVWIKGKAYKVGDMVQDAKIIAIGPTQVKIEWDGKEKIFLPINAEDSQPPDGAEPRQAMASRGQTQEGRAQMVTVGPQAEPMPTRGDMEGPGGMRGRFQDMSEAERERFRAEMRERRARFENMSEAERERFRAEMRERFGGRRGQGGGRGSGGRQR